MVSSWTKVRLLRKEKTIPRAEFSTPRRSRAGKTDGILFVAAAQIYMYFYTANTMVKRDAEVTSGGTIRVDAAATEDRLLFKASNGSEQELPYAKMKKIIQTKRLILIRSEANLCYILPKDTFTKGTPEAFLALLKEKRA